MNQNPKDQRQATVKNQWTDTPPIHKLVAHNELSVYNAQQRSLLSTFLPSSQVRGIFLVCLGFIAFIFYYSWWFHEERLQSPWLLLGLIGALFYSSTQLLGSWLLYLGNHHRIYPWCSPTDRFTVDIFIPTCGEARELIEESLKAACAMQGAHRIWLLDDGQDPALALLAQDLQINYLTRPTRKDAKAGNLNAALARTNGDIVVIFDIDHVPQPEFLYQTIGYFTDPAIGFVQVMPTFSNDRKGFVARAATETSLDFYNPTSKGMDAFYSVTKMGSNALIRRTALDSIGGYQPGLAEDLATSIALHAAGWRSRYVAEPLAPGLAPPDLASWFTQQFKWSRGVFEVLLTTYPRLFLQLTWWQRLSYGVRTTKYLIGPVIFVHLAVLIFTLFSGSFTTQSALQQYLLHLAPIALIDMLIRQLALRKWHHPSIRTEALWRAVVIVFITWPVYTLAWLMALLRLPLSFRPTPKHSTGHVNPLWLLPQMISLLLLSGGVLCLTKAGELGENLLIYLFVACFAVPQLALLRPLMRSVPINKLYKNTSPPLTT